MARKYWVGAAALSLLAVGQWVGAPASAQPASAGQAPLTSAEAQALSTNVSQRVVVVLKDQVTQAPASRQMVRVRKADVTRDQDPIRRELGSTKSKNVHSYITLDAVSATVSPGEEDRLAANPSVAEVVPDEVVQLGSPFADTAPTGSAPSSDASNPSPGSCPAPGSPPLLAPQALSLIHADSADANARTARSLGFTGSGVTVAFIADGLDINDTDFIRPDGTPVFVDYKDFSGEGTNVATGGGEAFLDASSIAAQGRKVYNVSHYSDLGLNRPCDIRVEGVAPGASLVGLDVFGAENAGFTSSVLQAIDYAVSVDHVNVINESLGNNPFPDDAPSLDLIKRVNDQAVAAGVTVTTSTGDAGPTGTIDSPASDPLLISAGATTSFQANAEIGYGGAMFGSKGWEDNNISPFSSSGVNQFGQTLSVVAPGDSNWALCSTDVAMYSECTDLAGQPAAVQFAGGTSESAPLTAGVAALVIQAYAKTHDGAYPTPAVVKQIITSTADDIAAPGDLEGSGLLDAYRAVLAAEAYRTNPPAHQPATVLEGTSQFSVVGAADTTKSLTEYLTNEGSTSQTVHVASRTLGGYTSVQRATVTLGPSSQKITDYEGRTDNFDVVPFIVASGASQLIAQIAWSANPTASPVRVTLIDPQGRLAAYSEPQGNSGYGEVYVTSPASGRWTAYIWSPRRNFDGTTGAVRFGASVASYVALGRVSPSTLTLGPGQSAPVSFTATTPSTPGDASGSLVVKPQSGPDLAIPVSLRSLVPTGATILAGTLTGGNGRQSNLGQTQYYQLNVPGGAPEINASITLAHDPNNQLYAWLVDPSGQAEAFQSNGVVTTDTSGSFLYTNTLGTNLHVLDPAGGRWTLILDFAPQVSGRALSQSYTVSVDENPVPVGAQGLPSSSGRIIRPGSAVVVPVRVTNTGTAPEAYFIDARLDTTGQYGLAALFGPATTAPFTLTSNPPLYIVPPDSTNLVVSASTTGTEPIQFDTSPFNGDPDIASNHGRSVSVSISANPLTPGTWDMAPTTVGPFGGKGAKVETVNTAMVVTTAIFDDSVSTSTGDLWATAVNPAAPFSTVIVEPGDSTTIPVTITADEPPGTTVAGTLYVDDASLVDFGNLLPNGNQVAALPYTYTVGRS